MRMHRAAFGGGGGDVEYSESDDMCGALGGMCCGCLLFPLSFVILGWNEQRAVYSAEAIDKARKSFIQEHGCVPTSQVRNGDLVSVVNCKVQAGMFPSGTVQGQLPDQDVLTGLGASGTITIHGYTGPNVLSWTRTGEQYQYHESEHTRTWKCGDGKTCKKTVYTYSGPAWYSSHQTFSGPHPPQQTSWNSDYADADGLVDHADLYQVPSARIRIDGTSDWGKAVLVGQLNRGSFHGGLGTRSDMQLTSYTGTGSFAVCAGSYLYGPNNGYAAEAAHTRMATAVITYYDDHGRQRQHVSQGPEEELLLPDESVEEHKLEIPERKEPEEERYYGGMCGSSSVGRWRWKFEYRTAPSEASALGQLDKSSSTQSNVEAWQIKEWETGTSSTFMSVDAIGEVQDGECDGNCMLSGLESQNSVMTWVCRFAGYLCMFIGLQLLVAPIAIAPEYFASYLPCEAFGIGRLISGVLGAALCCVNCGIACSCSLLTIAVAWLAFRPMIGIPLLVVAVACVSLAIFVAMKHRNRKSYKPTPAAVGDSGGTAGGNPYAQPAPGSPSPAGYGTAQPAGGVVYTPPAQPQQGYPPAQQGYPPAQPQQGYPPAQQGYPPAQPQQGYPPAQPQQGYPPATQPQQGYPPSAPPPPGNPYQQSANPYATPEQGTKQPTEWH